MKKYKKILILLVLITGIKVSSQNTAKLQKNIISYRNQILKSSNKIDSLYKLKSSTKTKYSKNILYFKKQLHKTRLQNSKKIDSLKRKRNLFESIKKQNIRDGFKKEAVVNKDYIKKLEALILNEKKKLQKQGIMSEKEIQKEIHIISEKKQKELFKYETLISEKKELIQNLKDSIKILFKKPLTRKINKESITNVLFENPLRGNIKITSEFGYRIHPIYKQKRFHNGIDLVSNLKKVYSSMPGIVKKVEYDKNLGIYVEIQSENGYTTIYGHLSKIYVLENQRVGYSHQIGEIGSTGSSTGDHLHFIIKNQGKYINPKSILIL